MSCDICIYIISLYHLQLRISLSIGSVVSRVLISSVWFMEKMDADLHLPPGFRFFPTDEELITHYLTRKASDNNFASRAIAVVDLNKFEPWDLPGSYS